MVSDGSNRIYITSPEMEVLQTLEVVGQDRRPQSHLNELEYVVEQGRGYLYCNVYPSERVVKVDLETGVMA